MILGGAIGGSFIVQSLASSVMSSLWGILNALQIITFFPLLNINLLPHVFIFFQILLVSHFDMLPVGDAMNEKVTKQEEHEAYRDNFELFGYETDLSILNFSDFWSAGAMALGMVVLFIVLYKISVKLRLTK